MSKIFNYEDVYKKLKNGEDIIPLSREEAFSMALLQKMQGTNNIIDEIDDEENNQFAILHNKLINEEEVIPVSREEAFSMMLLKNVSNDYGSKGIDIWKDGLLPWSDGEENELYFNKIVYSNGLFVARAVDDLSGTYGPFTLYYSTNGVNWTNTGITNVTGDLVCANGVFIFLTYRSAALCSTDGINWSSIDNIRGECEEDGATMVYGNGMHVLTTGFMNYRSSTGIKWVPLVTEMTQVVYGNGMFVGVGDVFVYYSTNGSGWTTLTPTDIGLDNPVAFTGVVYANGKFIAFEKESKFLYSTDGINWSSIDETFTHLTSGNGVFVGVKNESTDEGGHSISYSMDGVNWNHQVDVNEHSIIYSGYYDDKFVVIYDDYTIKYTKRNSVSKSLEEAINELYNITNECLQRIKVLEGGE